MTNPIVCSSSLQQYPTIQIHRLNVDLRPLAPSTKALGRDLQWQ